MTADSCFTTASIQQEAADQKFREGILYQHAANQERMRGNLGAYFIYTVAANQRFKESVFLNAAAQDSYERYIELSDVPESIASAANHTPTHCDTRVHHPSDPDRFGSGRPNTFACESRDRWVIACDRHVDGHRVRAHYIGEWAPHMAVQAGWVPSRSCRREGTAGFGHIIQYRVCVEQEGCSAWRKP